MSFISYSLADGRSGVMSTLFFAYITFSANDQVGHITTVNGESIEITNCRHVIEQLSWIDGK